jgi:5-formyltetrahydrofolate cyclo-ligase
MVPGPSRILEPDERTWIPVDDVDLVLVPGLAFDAAGGRVGHGQGHFDRTLRQARAGRPVKAALAFEFQVFDQVPTTESDVRMDVIVTERRVIRTKSAAGAV